MSTRTSAVKWHQGPLRAFDTETSGVDAHTERIVTAAVVSLMPGARPLERQWLINPGLEVPAEAAAVHGWTNDRIEATLGRHEAARLSSVGGVVPITREQALFEIAASIANAMGQEIPVVAANAAYDLTLLEAELARNGVPTLSVRPTGIVGVVDPMVLDKQHDPYRKACYRAPGCDREAKHHECGGCRGGKVRCGGCGATDRTLTSLCKHYGVPLTTAHNAAADALAAARLVPKIAAAWPDIARLRLATLHENQVRWKQEQMVDLAAWFRKNGEHDKADSCDPGWPLQTAPTRDTETVDLQGALL